MTDCSISLSPSQIDQLHRVSKLIGNDWSGCNFDGRNVRNWIDSILSGEDVDKELKEYESQY